MDHFPDIVRRCVVLPSDAVDCQSALIRLSTQGPFAKAKMASGVLKRDGVIRASHTLRFLCGSL